MSKIQFIDRDQLAARLKETGDDARPILLIDVAGNAQEETLPCAHRVDFERIVLNRGDRAGLLPEISDLNAALSHTGISADRPVVLFDAQNGLAASRLTWTLALCGIQEIMLVDGGRAAMMDLQDNIPTPQPEATEPLQYHLDKHHADAETIVDHLDRWLIVDARSEAEYAGSDRRSKHAGHIPGAIHFDWNWCMDPARPGYLRPIEEIRAHMHQQGIRQTDAGRPIAVYCQSHRRSSLLFCVLKHLGFDDVRGYPGAWSDWGNRDDMPIACALAESTPESES